MGTWFDAPAEAYDRFVGRYGRALARELATFADVRPGSRVLDVGAGPGALTAELADRVGSDHVVAAEPTPGFAAACAHRLPQVRVEVAGAEDLPFADAEFDTVLAQLVVPFIPDPPAGVREMARVTRPGGRVVAAVWDYAGEMTLLRAFWDAARALDPAAGGRDEARVMHPATPDALARLWVEAGLSDVETGAATVNARYDGFADLWDSFLHGIGPAGAYVAALAPAARGPLAADLRRRLGAGDEPFTLSARAWLVRGVVR